MTINPGDLAYSPHGLVELWYRCDRRGGLEGYIDSVPECETLLVISNTGEKRSRHVFSRPGPRASGLRQKRLPSEGYDMNILAPGDCARVYMKGFCMWSSHKSSDSQVPMHDMLEGDLVLVIASAPVSAGEVVRSTRALVIARGSLGYVNHDCLRKVSP